MDTYLWICALFIGLFGLSTLLHFGQAIRFRMWWLLPTAVLAGLAEIIGWSGRLWSSKNPLSLDPYLMQITTTIIAPTPLVAANFIILGRVIQRLGRQYSRLSPKWYTIIFCSFDLIALIVQAVGGASASQAAESHSDPKDGGNIMLGGIAFQMAAITIYAALAIEFILRYFKDRPVRKISHGEEVAQVNEEGTLVAEPGRVEKGGVGGPRAALTRRIKLMLIGLSLSTVFIFIRSVYRTIELADGWTGKVITTQVWFNVFDGAMIVLAMYTLNFFHPGVLLRERRV